MSYMSYRRVVPSNGDFRYLTVLSCLFSVYIASNKTLRNSTHEERLLDVIFENYNKVARAAITVEETVVVYVDFVLLRIHGLVGNQ